MRVDMLTREYPPAIYGGAGVHVAELVAVLRRSIEVQVRCFGEPRDEADVTAYPVDDHLAASNAALGTLGVDVAMAADLAGANLIHSHTWYSMMGGHLGALLHGIPHVITAHSLEPLRPWKAEQLGGGYALSSWAERTAYEGAAGVIAVSAGMREDILRCYPNVDAARVHVVHNGIDLDSWQRSVDDDYVRTLGIDPNRRAVVFVGRITRQKGLPYLLRAAANLPDDVQLILCAGAPDTPEIAAEVTGLVSELQTTRDGVIWIEEMLPRERLINVLSAATLFVCPSIYEPLGIVNLEAMACGVPVVGSRTGGIPEVVVHGETGVLVNIDQVQDGTGTPTDPEQWIRDLTTGLLSVLDDEAEARRMGEASRRRVEEHFSWDAVGERTLEVYRKVLAGS